MTTGSPAGEADHQAAWKLDAMVDKFATKTASDFFRSETRFMPAIASARSVLDVGCASGRLIELLGEHLEPGFAFTGVDVVGESIDRARATYPDHRFLVGDFLGLDGELDRDGDARFDFANATGVVQHEPRYRQLIDAMVARTDGWVLFDAKLSPRPDDLIDRERSWVDIEHTRLFFNVLAFGPLVEWLSRRPRVAAVSVYAYPAEPNQRTTVPDDLGPFASAGVFLSLGERDEATPAPVELDVPDFLAEVVG